MNIMISRIMFWYLQIGSNATKTPYFASLINLFFPLKLQMCVFIIGVETTLKQFILKMNHVRLGEGSKNLWMTLRCEEKL